MLSVVQRFSRLFTSWEGKLEGGGVRVVGISLVCINVHLYWTTSNPEYTPGM